MCGFEGGDVVTATPTLGFHGSLGRPVSEL